MKLENFIDKEKMKCPYCSRKASYGKRFLSKDKGEYLCDHCKKVSNVKQNSNLWMLMILATTISLLILIFYLAGSNSIQKIYDEEGRLRLLVGLFFGNAMIFKWIIWEIIPFIVFYFLSPAFVEFYPQKRYMEQTQSKIDLSVPASVSASSNLNNTAHNTGSIPKTERKPFEGIYEDISSSSDIDKTRAFRVTDSLKTESFSDINNERITKSNSYRSDAPLVKVNREVPVQREEVKEYIPQKERINTEKYVNPAQKNTQTSNYSANRKF